MNVEIEKKYQRLRGFFFGLCILAAGLFFLITAKNIYKSVSSEHWQTYKGVMKERPSGRGIYYTSLLRYDYEVNGKMFQGTRIGYGAGNMGDVQLTSDSAVKVYVNPRDPTDAVLVTGFKKTHFVGLLFSGGFLWLAFYLWRKTK